MGLFLKLVESGRKITELLTNVSYHWKNNSAMLSFWVDFGLMTFPFQVCKILQDSNFLFLCVINTWQRMERNIPISWNVDVKYMQSQMLPKIVGRVFTISRARILCPVFLVMLLAFLLTTLLCVPLGSIFSQQVGETLTVMSGIKAAEQYSSFTH